MNKYLFCYSKQMRNFLMQKGFRYICIGINDKTNTRFWLFEKTAAIKKALDEYDNK